MKLLLDQGLPRTSVDLLRQAEIDTLHTAEMGLATASDEEILRRAAEENRVVITLDAVICSRFLERAVLRSYVSASRD